MYEYYHNITENKNITNNIKSNMEFMNFLKNIIYAVYLIIENGIVINSNINNYSHRTWLYLFEPSYSLELLNRKTHCFYSLPRDIWCVQIRLVGSIAVETLTNKSLNTRRRGVKGCM